MKASAAVTSTAVFAIIVAVLVGSLGAASLLSQSATTGAGRSESGETSSVTAPANNVKLTASISTDEILVGQNLSVSVSLSSAYLALNIVTTSQEWPFQAFPVAIWPPCFFSLPVQFVVLHGNYSFEEIPTINDTAPAEAGAAYACTDVTVINQVRFLPDSDRANLTGTFLTQFGVNLGPYDLDSHFTINGYWDYPITNAEGSDLFTPVSGGLAVAYPEVSPVAAHRFSPGVYTVAFDDEWGQSVVLHFTVLPPAQKMTPRPDDFKPLVPLRDERTVYAVFKSLNSVP